MPEYEVIVHPKAEADLRRLPRDAARRILRACLELGRDPFPGGKRVKRLAGVVPPAARLRVGDYRVLFRTDENSRRLFVLRVVHRSGLARGIAGMPAN